MNGVFVSASYRYNVCMQVFGENISALQRPYL